MTKNGDTALALLGELANNEWLGLARRGTMGGRGAVWCDHCDGKAVPYDTDSFKIFKHERGCLVLRVREFMRGL